MMNNAMQLLSTVRTVAAPHGPSCDVITFDFVPQLLKLLQNWTIMTQDNLLIDVHNPLLPYKRLEARSLQATAVLDSAMSTARRRRYWSNSSTSETQSNNIMVEEHLNPPSINT